MDFLSIFKTLIIMITLLISKTRQAPTTLECIFTMINKTLYQCEANTITTNRASDYIEKVTGKHIEGQSNEDVTVLRLENSEMSNIPNNISDFLPSVDTLLINNDNLKKIVAFNLAQFKKLRRLQMKVYSITKLDADLFEHNQDLLDFEFVTSTDSYERLQSVHPK